MSTKYRMYINYDNDKKVYVVPVLPEKIQVTHKGQTTSTNIDMFGEVLHKGKRDAAIFKWSSFFPAQFIKSLCACKQSEFKKPNAWHSWMKKLEEEKKPCHFVLTGSPFSINLYADIISYVGEEVGGDPGTIQYTVELKEHRDPTIREIKVTQNGSSGSSGNTRVNNNAGSTTYRVTASALNLRTGPNQTIVGVMPNGASVTTDGQRNGGWIHVQYNGTWGWAYLDYLKQS